MEKQIIEMFKLQDTLNKKTSGDNWKLGVTNKGKIINWRRCIYMELAEAIDSVSWKHWKNIDGGIDYENFKVELIDIWHFLMSELLRFYSIDELVILVTKYSKIKSNIKLPINWKKENNTQIDDILEPYENLMALSLLKIDDKDYLESLIESFFICLDSAGISFDGLYKLYIGKNVLNKFRQDHGYKEGVYIKIWNGEEDNVVMQKIIENTLGFDEIYTELEEVYSKFSKI
ncbi:dUTP diphosphatase [Candidatus Gracilibacteria bacterium]|nr:dUTP diphosphatase [Candidatus Gracilibacteria bacterium]